MTILSGLGIVLSLVFGCLLLALVAELYYLLWWKKQRINSNNDRIEENDSNHSKELFYLFCWDKPTSVNITNSNPIVANPEDPDVELGLASSKDLLLKALAEDGVESEIMRLHNLMGPPRFLFTIKEETREDLESEDGKSRGDRSRKGSRTRSLSDLIMAFETQTPFLSPLASPPVKPSSNLANNNNYNNPLFESSVEAELDRLRSSPPPKFKFLRDAEEKLYKKLLQEAQKSAILQEVVLDNPPTNLSEGEKEGKDGSLIVKSKVVNGGKNKALEVHCSSQVLPLSSSPSDP